MKILLNISGLIENDFENIFKFAKSIKPNNDICLKDQNIKLIFEKNSTRTRPSFQVDIKLDELNLTNVELFEDTFEIMPCYLDVLKFRTTNQFCYE